MFCNEVYVFLVYCEKEKHSYSFLLLLTQLRAKTENHTEINERVPLVELLRNSGRKGNQERKDLKIPLLTVPYSYKFSRVLIFAHCAEFHKFSRGSIFAHPLTAREFTERQIQWTIELKIEHIR